MRNNGNKACNAGNYGPKRAGEMVVAEKYYADELWQVNLRGFVHNAVIL